MTEGPKLIYLGVVEGGTNAIVLPTQPLRRIEARLDREQAKREAEAAKAKLRIMQDVRGRVRLKKALKICFGRGRRGR
jgi:hypothetical protein